MALVLTEEQSMLRDSARGLIGDKAPVSHLRHLRDTRDATGFSRDLWAAFAEMGLSGLIVPEEFGGSGLGCVEAGVVMEEIGRTLMPSPFLSTAVLAAAAWASPRVGMAGKCTMGSMPASMRPRMKGSGTARVSEPMRVSQRAPMASSSGSQAWRSARR